MWHVLFGEVSLTAMPFINAAGRRRAVNNPSGQPLANRSATEMRILTCIPGRKPVGGMPRRQVVHGLAYQNGIEFNSTFRNYRKYDKWPKYHENRRERHEFLDAAKHYVEQEVITKWILVETMLP